MAQDKSTHNPEFDPDNQPFEAGERVTMTGDEWVGCQAIIHSVRWTTDYFAHGSWEVFVYIYHEHRDPASELPSGRMTKEILAWYPCGCCSVWAVKNN